AACTAWARPISPPSGVTAALFDMFCALNGATRTPRRASARHSPAAIRLLPTLEPVPSTAMASARAIYPLVQQLRRRERRRRRRREEGRRLPDEAAATAGPRRQAVGPGRTTQALTRARLGYHELRVEDEQVLGAVARPAPEPAGGGVDEPGGHDHVV